MNQSIARLSFKNSQRQVRGLPRIVFRTRSGRVTHEILAHRSPSWTDRRPRARDPGGRDSLSEAPCFPAFFLPRGEIGVAVKPAMFPPSARAGEPAINRARQARISSHLPRRWLVDLLLPSDDVCQRTLPVAESRLPASARRIWLPRYEAVLARIMENRVINRVATVLGQAATNWIHRL